MEAKQGERRWVRQLARLEMLMDVVYGLTIWRLFQFLPRPTEDETRSLWEVFTDDLRSGLTVIIGIVIVIIYWMQNNLLFGHLTAPMRGIRRWRSRRCFVCSCSCTRSAWA